MKKIIGFDSWTGGCHNFARLVPAFKQRGLDLLLIHLGSWGGDVNRPKEENIGDLKVRDILYYEGKNLFSILKEEQPEAVLFLSNDVFAHRAVNRFCRLLNIPTVHLYHGLVEIQSTQGERMYKVNPLNQMFYVLRRIPKALLNVWPTYAYSLYKTKAGFSDWVRFIDDIVQLTLGKYVAKAATDSLTNACVVYTSADATHAMTKYGYSKDNVHIVGNPDLSRFNLNEEMLGAAVSASRDVTNEIVYIDTGLIYAGMVFSGACDFLKHLTDLRDELAKQGFKLAVKLHPDHYRTDFPRAASDCGVRVIDNTEFVLSLFKCRAAMVEPSTAALIPALLGLPLLMVSFGKLQNQEYGKVLLDYPRSGLISDSVRVSAVIADIENREVLDINEWIGKNVGPLPASDMPVRVATLIQRVILVNKLQPEYV